MQKAWQLWELLIKSHIVSPPKKSICGSAAALMSRRLHFNRLKCWQCSNSQLASPPWTPRPLVSRSAAAHRCHLFYFSLLTLLPDSHLSLWVMFVSAAAPGSFQGMTAAASRLVTPLAASESASDGRPSPTLLSSKASPPATVTNAAGYRAVVWRRPAVASLPPTSVCSPFRREWRKRPCSSSVVPFGGCVLIFPDILSLGLAGRSIYFFSPTPLLFWSWRVLRLIHATQGSDGFEQFPEEAPFTS